MEQSLIEDTIPFLGPSPQKATQGQERQTAGTAIVSLVGNFICPQHQWEAQENSPQTKGAHQMQHTRVLREKILGISLAGAGAGKGIFSHSVF
jgi:hypothetical protein